MLKLCGCIHARYNKKKHPQKYKQEHKVMLCAKNRNTDTDFKLQLSGGLLSSRVNHSLPMNTSNWVKAFVFGCGSEGKATGETLLAFVICVLKERKPCNGECTCGHPKHDGLHLQGQIRVKSMSWTSLF